ncbi:hypothetical protein [Pseudoxanthomonas sp. PXM02]|uniref:hypothetical protein n=1 Tax=Pseudoxanthomonas sp. PXM02 TaxID=2769294 RepID=UPI0017831393|nr:hypothetical protein [Pseudoxanthomonas sp. PXM02]MBD9477401.1 hypothetical protein [Pseudoxanthomonas sp. PXM02]
MPQFQPHPLPRRGHTAEAVLALRQRQRRTPCAAASAWEEDPPLCSVAQVQLPSGHHYELEIRQDRLTGKILSYRLRLRTLR